MTVACKWRVDKGRGHGGRTQVHSGVLIQGCRWRAVTPIPIVVGTAAAAGCTV